MMLRLTGAEVIVRALVHEGVPRVFGVAGGKLMPLMHALSKEPRIGYVGVRHEAAAPLMAAAVYAGSGSLCAALGEMGPGSANLLAGVGTAFANHLPLLLITTNQHRAASYPHRGMFMDYDAGAAFSPVTRWNATVGDARRLPELLRTAFRHALSGSQGPVHLDVPQDVLAQVAEFDPAELALQPSRYRSIGGPRPTREQAQHAARLLSQARRPLLIAGGGVVAAQASPSFRELTGLLGAPAICTQMGIGCIASDSPNFIGHGGLIGGEALLKALREADVILAAGCRFSSWLWDDQGPMVRADQTLININIDPSALGEPAIHELAIQADANEALTDIVEAFKVLPAIPKTSAKTSDWLDGLRQSYANHGRLLRELAAVRRTPMHPAALAQSIGESIPSDALVVYDGGHTTFWSNDFTPVAEPRSRFHDPGMSQLGFGLPYAIGLKSIHPDRPVINVTGDGAFGFTLAELDTARRYKLPVINIVHNNAAWGIIKAGQRKALNFSFGADLDGTDYAAIGRGFDAVGEIVERPEDLPAALARALASGKSAVLDCRTAFEPHPCLPAFGKMNAFGFKVVPQ